MSDTNDHVLSALSRLVELKDGPRDEAYYGQKELAWHQARAALVPPGECYTLPNGDCIGPTCTLHLPHQKWVVWCRKDARASWFSYGPTSEGEAQAMAVKLLRDRVPITVSVLPAGARP